MSSATMPARGTRALVERRGLCDERNQFLPLNDWAALGGVRPVPGDEGVARGLRLAQGGAALPAGQPLSGEPVRR